MDVHFFIKFFTFLACDRTLVISSKKRLEGSTVRQEPTVWVKAEINVLSESSLPWSCYVPMEVGRRCVPTWEMLSAAVHSLYSLFQLWRIFSTDSWLAQSLWLTEQNTLLFHGCSLMSPSNFAISHAKERSWYMFRNWLLHVNFKQSFKTFASELLIPRKHDLASSFKQLLRTAGIPTWRKKK